MRGRVVVENIHRATALYCLGSVLGRSGFGSALGLGFGSTLGSAFGAGFGLAFGVDLGSDFGFTFGSDLGRSGTGSTLGMGLGSLFGSTLGVGLGWSFGSTRGRSVLGSPLGAGFGSTFGSPFGPGFDSPFVSFCAPLGCPSGNTGLAALIGIGPVLGESRFALACRGLGSILVSGAGACCELRRSVFLVEPI